MRVFKKLTIISILGFCFFNLSAQEGFMGGVGPTYELNNDLAGTNARLYYGPNEKFCFGPEASYYPYQKINDEYEASIIDLNINAHYIFEVTHKLGIYPVSGLNFTIEKERLIEFKDDVFEEEELGLNYGLGAHYNLGKIFAFVEFKGVIGQLNDEFLTAGILFNLSKKKEHH